MSISDLKTYLKFHTVRIEEVQELNPEETPYYLLCYVFVAECLFQRHKR